VIYSDDFCGVRGVDVPAVTDTGNVVSHGDEVGLG
jgi:hypothetical protein